MTIRPHSTDINMNKNPSSNDLTVIEKETHSTLMSESIIHSVSKYNKNKIKSQQKSNQMKQKFQNEERKQRKQYERDVLLNKSNNNLNNTNSQNLRNYQKNQNNLNISIPQIQLKEVGPSYDMNQNDQQNEMNFNDFNSQMSQIHHNQSTQSFQISQTSQNTENTQTVQSDQNDTNNRMIEETGSNSTNESSFQTEYKFIESVMKDINLESYKCLYYIIEKSSSLVEEINKKLISDEYLDDSEISNDEIFLFLSKKQMNEYLKSNVNEIQKEIELFCGDLNQKIFECNYSFINITLKQISIENKSIEKMKRFKIVVFQKIGKFLIN